MQQQPQAQSPETFPLADIAMQFLRTVDGEEPLAFASQGPRALEVGLTALFSSGLATTPALNNLLGLALVLDQQRQSPTAARQIRDAVRRDPRAMNALGISTADATRIRRGTARLTGANESELAPVFGSASPKGAQTVASMIDPLALDRSRVGAKVTRPKQAPAPARPAPKPADSAAKDSTTRRKFDVH